LVAETIDIPVGTPYQAEVHAIGMTLQYDISFSGQPWYYEYCNIYISITDDDGNWMNITISVGENTDPAIYISTSAGEEEVLASAPNTFYISKYAIHIVNRIYEHNVNLSNALITVSWDSSGVSGELSITVNEYGALIPEEPIAAAPDPFTAVGEFFSFLQIAWQGLVTWFNLIAATINIVWSIIVFVFNYVGIILGIVNEYVLPNLALFIGIYFFATLGMAVADLPKKGFTALIDWGKLWYGHIMALVNFIKMLAYWAQKIIDMIIKLIDAITPFT